MPQDVFPEALHRERAVGEERLVEGALVERALLPYVALEPLDLAPPEEVLAELRRVELRAYELLLRLGAFLEAVLDHEAERLLVGHGAALQLRVEHGIRGDDHPAAQIEESIPIVSPLSEAVLDEKSLRVHRPPLGERAAPERGAENGLVAPCPERLRMMAGNCLVRGSEGDLVIVVRAQVALHLVLGPGGVHRIDVVRAVERRGPVE